MSAKLLQRTLRGGDRLVSPFLILGDPTPARSVDLCVALVRSGAGMLELGIHICKTRKRAAPFRHERARNE